MEALVQARSGPSPISGHEGPDIHLPFQRESKPSLCTPCARISMSTAHHDDHFPNLTPGARSTTSHRIRTFLFPSVCPTARHHLYHQAGCEVVTFYSRQPFPLQAGRLQTPPRSPCRVCSATLAQALEELHADGDAHVPAQRDQADVAGHDGRPQQVLHRRRAVRVAIEHL